MSSKEKLEEKSIWHPKFVERWGKLYLARYVKNPKEAIKWAIEFFPDALINVVADAASREMRKRGIRIKDPNK